MKRKKLKTVLSLLITFLFAQINYAQTVTIGKQVWMTKNLNVDKFRNGDSIPQAKTYEEWEAAGENKQPAWCYYDNDPANGAKYGKLYNCFAVNDSRGLAPAGYHIPSDEEWTKLTDYLGESSAAGTKMKSASGWKSITRGGSKTCPNCSSWNAEYRKKVPCHTCKDTRTVTASKVTSSGNGTNSSKFSGLPGGYRGSDGTFDGVGYYAYWWSSSEGSTSFSHSLRLSYLYDFSNRNFSTVESGFSVRCLKD